MQFVFLKRGMGQLLQKKGDFLAFCLLLCVFPLAAVLISLFFGRYALSPSAVIAALFQTVVDNPYIQGMIRGIRAIAVAIILGNAVRLLKTIRKDAFSIILVICAITIPLFFGFSAFYTILTCGLAGIISIFLESAAAGKKDKDAEKEKAK